MRHRAIWIGIAAMIVMQGVAVSIESALLGKDRTMSAFRISSLTCVLLAMVFTANGFGRTTEASALLTPPADAIDVTLLQTASRIAARNALASLIARQSVNHGLVVRPRERSKRVVSGYKKDLEIRCRWTEVEVPVRKVVNYHEIRRPRTDRYGNITGYKTVKIPEYRVVGTRKIRRLVRDPDGPIRRTVKQPIYAKGDSTTHVPHGLLGLNGMALYVMSKAGLTSHAADQAGELKIMVNTIGLPDTTWDLAWLVAGFVQLDDADYRPLIDRLVSKLIDGQVRQRGPAMGLWGPICIHHPALARYLSIEIQLHEEINRIRQKYKGQTDDAQAQARFKNEIQPYEKLLDQIRLALLDTATQGGTFSMYNRPFEVQKNYFLPGLPYDFYHTTIVDLDSTFLAIRALAEAAAHDRLPAKTQRPLIRGRILMPPENTRKTLVDALVALSKVQQRNGAWDEADLVTVNHVYDRYPQLQLPDVPPADDPPPLLSTQTYRSNLRGLAAFMRLIEAMKHRPAVYARRLAPSVARATGIVEQMLGSTTLWKRLPSRRGFLRNAPAYHVYRGVQDSLEDILEAKQGTAPRSPPSPGIEQLPAGYTSEPYSLLSAVGTIFGKTPQESADENKKADLYDRLAYRLLTQQGVDGQWHQPGWGADVSSGLYAYLLQSYDARWIERYRKAGENGSKKLHKTWLTDRADRMMHAAGMYGHIGSMDFSETYATLASLVFLLERIAPPIEMRRAIILTPELVQRMNPYDDEAVADQPAPADPSQPALPAAPAAKPPKPTQPPTADDAAAEVIRPNEALDPLLDAVRKKLGLPLPAAHAAQPAPPGEPTESTSSTPAPNDEADPNHTPAGHRIDDILGE